VDPRKHECFRDSIPAPATILKNHGFGHGFLLLDRKKYKKFDTNPKKFGIAHFLFTFCLIQI